ncbi:MAG: hypothetical protein SFW09_05675 [Hyphomicrobiaceae bacterium]|nr:hypothetical protein [Hyphomicrobiaceae bacterium]
MTIRAIGAAVAFGLALAGAADANPLKSLYTTIELKSCRQVKRHADGGAWLCPGLEGYPVYVADGDQRTFVSVGVSPDKRQAATQTLVAFNSLFKGKSDRATLEWRIVRRDGRPMPFATIQKYYTRDDRRTGEVLVVTRVTDKEDCHVAHIDALANPDAIALARQVADRDARSFNCASKPGRVGKTGRSPM